MLTVLSLLKIKNNKVNNNKQIVNQNCNIMPTRMKRCVICGHKFEGWGNNPWPVKEIGYCCDKCNAEKVIPARLAQVYGQQVKS